MRWCGKPSSYWSGGYNKGFGNSERFPTQVTTSHCPHCTKTLKLYHRTRTLLLYWFPNHLLWCRRDTVFKLYLREFTKLPVSRRPITCMLSFLRKEKSLWVSSYDTFSRNVGVTWRTFWGEVTCFGIQILCK